jgi:F-type H+-transporting ATPase subunit b
MIAWAAETAAGHEAAFWHGADFWVLVAFLILIALFGRMVFRVIVTALDNRTAAIRERVEEAAKLRDEAQELLAACRKKHLTAADEAEKIIDRARKEVDRLRQRAEQDLERSLHRREQLASERIAQAQAAAIEEVRTAAVEIAVEATRRVLAEKLTARKANALVDEAIKDLPAKLRKLH